MFAKHILKYFLIITILFSFNSCIKTSDLADETDSITADIVIPSVDKEITEQTPGNVVTDVKTDQELPDEIILPYKNPLTGMPCSVDYSNSRPMAIMINNIKKATPQAGISNAEIIYECSVEGGITRLMALVCDYANLPEIGSVRSSREYYLDIAQSHDAIYTHCGGSEKAYSEINVRKIDNIDGVNGSYSEQWVTNTRL